MPIINISSLPQPQLGEMSQVLVNLNVRLAEEVGIAIKHLSSSWQFIEPSHYVDGNIICTAQPNDSHPIRAEVVLPTLLPQKKMQILLGVTAQYLSEISQLPIDNVLVYASRLQSGEICENGKILAWS